MSIHSEMRKKERQAQAFRAFQAREAKGVEHKTIIIQLNKQMIEITDEEAVELANQLNRAALGPKESSNVLLHSGVLVRTHYWCDGEG